MILPVKHIFGLTLALCILFSFTVKAQVTANFTSSNPKGCSPVVVTFSNTSTGATSYNWNFGNGNTSTQQNPVATYATPGVYTVTLQAFNGSATPSTIVKTNYVTVYENPSPNFSASTYTACIGNTVTFTNTTVIPSGGAPITSWAWDFGDGHTQTTSAPSITHAYTTAGNYPVSVIVTDNNGCSGSVIHNVTVIAAPIIAFTPVPKFACTPPLNVTFTNNSTTTGPASYLWDFGDGSTSAQTNPTHTYTNAGSYNVHLIITQNGCIDSLTILNDVVIQNIVPHFVATPTTICSGQSVSFTNTSVPSATISAWNFGDGATSTNSNPVHTYTAGGTYTVSLAATDANNCSGISSNTIVINQTPTAAFIADTLVACSVPFVVPFTNQSVAAGSYHWDFGDGSTSAQQNPTHSYVSAGVDTVQLVVSNANGTCSDSIKKNSYIIISPPVAAFASTPDSGCISLPVNFTSASTSSIDPITNYTWIFGDGNTNISSGINATNTYTAVGIYTPQLIIKTAHGCIDTVTCSNCIKAGVHPVASYSLAIDTVCYSIPVSFSNTSTNATGWNWIFGDGQNSMIPNASHVYGDTGTYHIKLVAFNNGCSDTSTIQNAVVLAPKAQFSYTLNCTNYFTVHFTNTSEGGDSLIWDFGDGSIDATGNNLNPVHTYTATGPVNVTLTDIKHKPYCSNSSTSAIVISKPVASFNPSASSGCYPFSTLFTSTSQDASSYYWDFGNPTTLTDTSTNSNSSYTYNLPGTYTTSLIITDVNGCKDSLKQKVIALGPLPHFVADTLTGCKPFKVKFKDISVDDSSLVKWNWNFGDGTPVVSTGNDSIFHTYMTPGNYSVSMVVKDTNGCKDSLTINNYIHPTYPFPAFTADTFSCKNVVITFNASATQAVGPTYNWNFGDGTQTTSHSPITTHTYSHDSLYTVTLDVIDTNGCDSPMVHTIRILKPVAKFGYSVIGTPSCGFIKVVFNDSSTGSVNSWLWNFGDGATSSTPPPTNHNYTQPGIYNVMLTVTNYGGCTDSHTLDSLIVVPGPTGTFSYSPLNGCSPLKVSFIGRSSDTYEYKWDFGDGTGTTTLIDSIAYTYIHPGVYYPSLTLVDASGCPNPILHPLGAINAINLVNLTLTPPFVIAPEDSIVNIHAAASGGASPYVYNWTPDTNINCLNCPNVQIKGAGDTLYYVCTVKDVNGCGDVDTLIVLSKPCVDKTIIPNIFSPNGDGKNDGFFIPGVCAADDYSLEIFDRWGSILFNTSLRNSSWDGKTNHGEDATEGTYFFVVKVAGKTYKGFFQLVR